MATDSTEHWGSLIIVGREGGGDIEFPLDKRSILIGRDRECTIRITNKEISRKHAEVYVEDTGAVFISSMGREPVSVNGNPVLSPLELATGDKIEVHLENRTRVLYFQGNDETVQINAPVRVPLRVANAVAPAEVEVAAKHPTGVPAGKEDGPVRRPAPPPPPPPPPPGDMLRPAKKPAMAPPPPPSPKPAAGVLQAASGGLSAALQNAIKAGVQLKKVPQQDTNAAQRAPAAESVGGMFVPNPADLLKLKAGLRKTAAAGTAAGSPANAANEPACGQREAVAAADAPEPGACAAGQPEPAADVRAAATQAAEVGAPDLPAADPANAVEPEAMAEPASAAGFGAEAQPADAEVPEIPAVAAPEAAAETRPTAEVKPAVDAAMEDVAVEAQEAAAEPAAAVEPATDATMQDAAAVGAAEASTEPVAVAAAAVPSSAMRKRKSVRFHVEEQQRVAGTPEGAARDATITIRLRKGDIEQTINVDDNTVAFSQWGLGTMGYGEQLEELPDTVVSKRSRPSTAPSSAGKTPGPSALRGLLACSPMVSGAQPTPGAGGPQAPAPTPATGARPSADGAGGLLMDPTTLANRLAQMAEQHDVTLEVPADFFKSPATGKDSLRVVLTPKSMGKALASGPGGPQEATVPASAAKSVPRSSGRSRLSLVGLAVQASPGAAPSADQESLEKTQEIDVPAELLAAIQASAKRQSVSRRRSLSRTPGAKVVIIEQATQTTPNMRASSATKLLAQGGHQTTQRLLSTIAILTETADSGDDVEQERSDEGGSADGSLELEEAMETVPLKQYHKAMLKAKGYHAEARQLAAQLRRMTTKAAKLKKAASALSGALDEERAKRQELQEAMQQVVLNRAEAEVAAKAEQVAALEAAEAAAAAALVEAAVEMGVAEEEEAAAEKVEEALMEQAAAPWVPRVVVLGQLSKLVSTAQRAGDVIIVRPSHLASGRVVQPAAPAAAPAPAVVVVPASARKTPAPSALKLARTPAPSAAKAAAPGVALAQGRTPAARRATPAVAAAAGTTPAAQRFTPAAAPGQGKAPAASAAKAGAPVLPKSMLKQAPGTAGATVVLENVELPDWLFEGEQQAPEVAAAAALAAEEEVPAAGVAAPVQAEDQALAAAAVKEADAPAATEGENLVAGEDLEQCAEAPTAEEEAAAADAAAPAQAAAQEVDEQQAPQQQLGAASIADMELDGGTTQASHQKKAVDAGATREASSSDDEEEEEEAEAEDYCHLCGQSDEGDILLLCDSCDNACHLSCCNPPLKRVPKGDWFCLECTARHQAEAAAAAAAASKAKAKPASKRSAKPVAAAPAAEQAEVEEQQPAKPARGRRAGAAPAAAAVAPAEEAAAKSGRGRGSKRAASEEPSVAAAAAVSEQASGRSKRGRAAAPKPSEEPAPSGRTRGKAAVSTASQATANEPEVSTRRSRAAPAPKPEVAAPPSRSTRSKR